MGYYKKVKKQNDVLRSNYLRIIILFGMLVIVAVIALLAADGDYENIGDTDRYEDYTYSQHSNYYINDEGNLYEDNLDDYAPSNTLIGIDPFVVPDPGPDWWRLNYAINEMIVQPNFILIHPTNSGVVEHFDGSIFHLVISDPNPNAAYEGYTITTLPIVGAPPENPHRINVNRNVSISAAPGSTIYLRMPVPNCTKTADRLPWVSGLENHGRHFFVESGTFILSGGGGSLILDGNAFAHDGYRGGVYVNGGNLFVQEGCRIFNGRAIYGGGVEVSGAGSYFTLDGIVGYQDPNYGNTATRGGGVFITDNAVFTMRFGSYVIGNTATAHASASSGLAGGGGVNVNGPGSRFYFDGGFISHNTALNAGAGVGVSNGAVFNMISGSIYRNLINGAYGGSGVYIRNSGSEFNMTGGYITHNTTVTTPSTASIGGVAVTDGATFEISGHDHVLISANSANNIGGIANLDSHVYINSFGNVVIEHNYALGPDNYLGTGFFQRGDTSVTIFNGTDTHIRHHNMDSSLYSATGVEVAGGILTMYDGTYIYDNVGNFPGRAGGLIITGGSVHMYGGVIRDNWGPSGGGVLVHNAYLYMLGGNIFANEAAYASGLTNGTGGGVMVYGDLATFDFYGGTIGHSSDVNQGNIALTGGGVWIGGGATVNMADNAEIMGNSAVSVGPQGGGGVQITGDGSILSITEGTIALNNAYNGGGVNILYGAELYMNGGVIRHNQALERIGGAHGAGGVRVGIGSRFNMYGDSVIRHNTTFGAGGGVRIEGIIGTPQSERGFFTMHGGTISHNGADTSAGGVFANGGIFTMLDGHIYNNRADTTGGGIESIANTYSEMIGGLVYDNFAERGGGLSVRSGTFTIRGGQIFDNRMQSNIPSTPILEGGGAYVTGTTSVLNMYGGVIGGNIEEHANQAETGGGVWVGNGATFNLTNYVPEWGPIVIGTGRIIGNNSIYANNTATNRGGGGVDVRGAGSTFNMSRGTVANNTSTTVGGGVKVYNGAHFSFSGGEINQNIANGVSPSGSGGGVHAARDSSVIMSEDASIHRNSSTNNSGGGVHTNGSSFTMTDGYIINNTAENHGGGVSLWSSGDNFPYPFYMSGGTIRGNTATNDGGGVQVGGAVSFMMTGGYIYSNTATNGGGVWVGGLRIIDDVVYKSTFDMTGGVIGGESNLYDEMGIPFSNGNTATYGGGVWVGNHAYFNLGQVILMMSADPNMGLITGNEALDNGATNSGSGGGVHVESGAIFSMRNGVIRDNNAIYGGGVFTHGENTLFDFIGGNIGGEWDASGTPILYNKATTTLSGRGGGGVEITGGSTMQMGHMANPGVPASITLNRAYNAGGGLNIHDSSSGVMHSGIISHNSTNNDDIYGNGGGVAVHAFSHFAMLDGLIESNVGRIGGGVYVYISSFDMYGGSISANASTQPGGGVAIYSGSDLVNSSSYFNMYDGLIINNGYQSHPFSGASTETPIGGGVVVSRHLGNVNMRGGSITNNFAYENGGGVAVIEGGSFYMSPSREPQISGNVAWNDGGGIWIYGVETRANANYGTRSLFIIEVFDGCMAFKTSEDCDHPNCVHSTNLYIIGNEAHNDGGGIAVLRGGLFEIKNPGFLGVVTHIMGNDAGNDGGGVFISGISDLDFANEPGNMLPAPYDPSEFIWDGYGLLQDNFAYENGGGIFVGNYEGNLASVSRGLSYAQPLNITRNTAMAYGSISTDGGGGGVYVSRNGEFYGNDISIINNHAPEGMGGGIFSEEHDYNSPLVRVQPTLLSWQTISYGNLELIGVMFRDNTAYARYIPPVNADIFHLPHIHHWGTSIPGIPIPTRVHVLNNYDINFTVPGVTFQFFKTDQQVYENPRIAEPLGGARFRVFRTENQHVATNTSGLIFLDQNNEPNAPWEEVFMTVDESPWSFASQPLTFSMTPGWIYQLVEYQAPNGFQIPMGQWRLRVNYYDASLIDIEPIGGINIPPFVPNDFTNINIEWFLGNWADLELPMTGGAGFSNPVTMTYATIGVAFIAGSGVFVYWRTTRKKRKALL